MTPAAAYEILQARGNADDAAGMAAYHKQDRPYLGVRVPVLTALAKEWRAECSLEERLELADGLWKTNAHEARVAAAKLLEQARIRPDDSGAWALIQSWVPEFDGWAIADHASTSGAKRLVADPARVDALEVWTTSDHLWTKRAALVMTLPWARLNNLKPKDAEIRERVLEWAADYVADKQWFIQKCVSWWLRELSKHDAARVAVFIEAHGAAMANFARKDATKYLR